MKIRYYGHIGQCTGYGRAGAHLCRALAGAGAELEISSPIPGSRYQGDNLPLASFHRPEDSLDPKPDAVIVHTLPGDCDAVLKRTEPVIASTGHRPAWIAYTTYETLTAPTKLVDGLRSFDRVWHPSVASAGSFLNALDSYDQMQNRIDVIPHCYNDDAIRVVQARNDVEFPRDERVPDDRPYRFYTIGALSTRKNLMGVIMAFASAFTAEDNVELVIVAKGLTEPALTQYILSTGFTPDQLPVIRCEFRELSDYEIWQLHMSADCYVCASHGEAWNLPAFEAMIAGRYVIAPHDLGHDDFLRDTTASLYGGTVGIAVQDVSLERTAGGIAFKSKGAQGLTAKQHWIDPDLVELAAEMKRCSKDRYRYIYLNYDIEKFGYQSVGARALMAIQRIIEEKKTRDHRAE